MSPERIVGNKYTFNADVWALGVILVEAALGRYPYLMEGMEKKKFEFWDLLDAMKNSPCVSCASLRLTEFAFVQAWYPHQRIDITFS